MLVTIRVMDWWNLAAHPVELVVQGPEVATSTSGTAALPSLAARPADQGVTASARPAVEADASVFPTLLKRVEPQYTDDARARKIQGKVVLSFFVMPNGYVRTIRIIQRLDTGLDRSAIAAVSQWHYSPALVNGRPTTVQVTAQIDFRLR